METEVLAMMHRRMVQDFLDVLVMIELRKRPLSGYDVIEFVHKKFRILMSSGTIYACLYGLERKRLVKGEHASAKRIYTLTEKGKEITIAFLKAKDKITRFFLILFGG